MKRVLLVIIALFLLATGMPAQAKPTPQDTPLNLRITVSPTELQQGQVATVHVREATGRKLERVQANYLGQLFDLYPTIDGDWFGLLAADMEATRGDQPLDIYAFPDGSEVPERASTNVPVIWGAFTYQDITISNELIALLDPETNRKEFTELARVDDRITAERLFNYFIPPVSGARISEFGGVRNYNGGVLEGRHTGMDFRANAGDVVGASAAGRVVFAQRLPIHGNHIIIDHGWGILTGYSHLSEILIVPGQLVRQGETIGLVGATGRVEGPHLHFEVVVNGVWIDPERFLTMEIPPALPNP